MTFVGGGKKVLEKGDIILYARPDFALPLFLLLSNIFSCKQMSVPVQVWKAQILSLNDFKWRMSTVFSKKMNTSP